MFGKDFLAELNSFKPFIMGENAIELFKGIIRVNLTQSLGTCTLPLCYHFNKQL